MEKNDKRIVKNTLYLYIRMLVMMALSFFSTRIVLNILGVSDFGVNNVVGGFVSMFTLLNSILQTGTRRFLALNLVKDNASLLKRTFSTAFVIHCAIALLVVVLLETFGVWFLNTYLNIAYFYYNVKCDTLYLVPIMFFIPLRFSTGIPVPLPAGVIFVLVLILLLPCIWGIQTVHRSNIHGCGRLNKSARW